VAASVASWREGVSMAWRKTVMRIHSAGNKNLSTAYQHIVAISRKRKMKSAKIGNNQS